MRPVQDGVILCSEGWSRSGIINMYDDLVEKLIKVDETALALPQQKMASKYRKFIGKKLKPTRNSIDVIVFWMLTDGAIVPVESCHETAAKGAGTTYEALLSTGAMRGYLWRKAGPELDIESRGITKSQLSVLVNLYLEYKFATVIVDRNKKSWEGAIKSLAEFKYAVEYGTLDEAVATKMSPEKAMRHFYKEEINGKLEGSTWTTETDWLKFWMFRNGDYIPVDHSHAKTSRAVHHSPEELEKAGMIQGSIKLDSSALNVSGEKLTSQQIARLRQFYVEYKPTSLFVSFSSRRGIGCFGKEIKSSGELDYALEYGLDEAVATRVDSNKVMKKFYDTPGVSLLRLNTKLVLSTFPTEKDWYKFWMLKDGSVLPVVFSHEETIFAPYKEEGKKRSCEAYDDAFKDGMLAGSVGKDGFHIHTQLIHPTDAQISKLIQFYTEHKPNTLYVDSKHDNFERRIKNRDELDYCLRYGSDKDVTEALVESNEAVATKTDSQTQMKDYWSKNLNGPLKKSTFPGVEGRYRKFWLLTDGTIIPVIFAHSKTAYEAGLRSMYKIYAEGALAGYIVSGVGEAGLRSESETVKLTTQQISKMKQLYNKYGFEEMITDLGFSQGVATISSGSDIVNYLSYGRGKVKKAWEAVEEEAIEVPEYLYHGTFKPLLSKINSEGLRIEGTVKNYSDSEAGLIYLAKNFEEAEAFAEVSETVPDEWVDQIVVLKIDTDNLDKSKLAYDPNVRDTEVMTFVYSRDIPSEAFEVL